MYGYAKKQLEEKIEELRVQNVDINQKMAELSKKILYLDSYQSTKGELSGHRVELWTGILLGTAIAIGPICGTLNAATSGLLSFLSIGCFGLSALAYTNVRKDKQVLKEYKEISHMSDKEVMETIKECTTEKYRHHTKSCDLEGKIQQYCTELKKMEMVQKVLDDLPIDPYYIADSEEEYQLMASVNGKYQKLLDDYLQEKIDVSTVHFHNEIEENIDYTESSKKFFKKM